MIMTDPTVHIVIPTLDGKIEQECLLGLLETWGKIPCELSLPKGCYIGRNRDIGTAEFLDGDCTHILYVDADISWRFSDLEKLLELNTGFAFGRYPHKGPTWKRGWVARGESSGIALMGTKGRLVDAVEWERCGGGFVLLSRSAVERMCEMYPGFRYVDPVGRELHGLWWMDGLRMGPHGEAVCEGEDYAVCRRWRELGERIFTRNDVSLGHVGSCTYRMY